MNQDAINVTVIMLMAGLCLFFLVTGDPLAGIGYEKFLRGSIFILLVALACMTLVAIFETIDMLRKKGKILKNKRG